MNFEINYFLLGLAIYLYTGVIVSQPLVNWIIKRHPEYFESNPNADILEMISFFIMVFIYPFMIIDVARYYWRKFMFYIKMYFIAKKVKRIGKKVLKRDPTNTELRDALKRL